MIIRRDFFQSAAVQDALQRYPYMQAIPQIMTLARPWPFIGYSDFSAAMGSALSRAWAGALPPEHALAEAEAAVNIALRGLR